ncbi:MAG TPA: hypothetical protein VHO06_04685 [Polyangia bacterium]|nr:hypothetical protein [Polyangia bacterium]
MVSTGLLAACSSDSSSPASGSAGAGGRAAGGAAGQAAGGAAGQATGGAAGQATGGAAGQAAGGAGGQATGGGGGQAMGGAGGQAMGGAGGQAAGGAGGSGCLDPTMFAASFSIADSSFCAVALYTAPEALGSQLPTWGSHGGPLVVQAAATGAAGASGTGVTLERWTAPAGTTGAMTVQTTPVASALPSGAFLGAQALDLPFFGWTAISWTNPFPDTTGKFEMIASGAIVTSYDVNGPFGVAAVPAASSLGRFFFSGLAPLGTTTTVGNGLYEADACSSPSQGLGSAAGCPASAAVATWGTFSGPIAADSHGDVFAVFQTSAASDPNPTQEARAFVASSVARGAAPTSGATLFTIGGYVNSLAALSPASNAAGAMVYQPADDNFAPGDVLEQQFTTSSTTLAPVGTTATLLTVPSGAGLSLMVDGSQRLWVAASDSSSTTYVVLARQ